LNRSACFGLIDSQAGAASGRRRFNHHCQRTCCLCSQSANPLHRNQRNVFRIEQRIFWNGERKFGLGCLERHRAARSTD
jgi:hypothetical protein